MIRRALQIVLLGVVLVAESGCRIEVPLDPEVDAGPTPVDANIDAPPHDGGLPPDAGFVLNDAG